MEIADVQLAEKRIDVPPPSGKVLLFMLVVARAFLVFLFAHRASGGFVRSAKRREDARARGGGKVSAGAPDGAAP